MGGELRSRVFICLLFSSVFNSWAFYSLVPTLPLYLLEDLRMNFREIGITISSFSVSVIIFRPIAGYIVDTIKRTKLLKITLAAVTLLYAMYPRIKTPEGLVALRICHGALFGISSSALSAIVADITHPTKIGQAIGFYSLTIPIGMIVGSFFGLKILRNVGAQAMFLFTLFVSSISLVLSFLLGHVSYVPEQKKTFNMASLFLKDAIPFSFSMVFPMVIYGSINTFAGVHAKQAGIQSTEIFFLLFSLSLLVSRFYAGKFFDRGQIRLLVFGGLFLILFGTLALGFSKSDYSFFFAGMLCGLGFGILMPTCQAAINIITRPEQRGSANSTYFLSYDLGIGLSSYVPGYFLDKTTVAEMYRVISSLTVVSAFLFSRIAIPYYEKRRGFNREVF